MTDRDGEDVGREAAGDGGAGAGDAEEEPEGGADGAEAGGGDDRGSGVGGDAGDDAPGFTPTERGPILDFWEREFGVPPATFDGHAFYEKGASKVWIVDDAVPVDEEPARETVGMPLIRVNREHWKPTTDALQRFGEHVDRNVVDLDAEQARRFAAGETVEAEYPELPSLGYVAVRYGGDVLGCGLYFPGELRSQVPKGRRVDLALPE